MKVTGGGNVLELGVEDERHHEPENHEMWQDSVVLCWWDLENEIGGYHRCGYVPLREQDVTETGFGCGDDACRFDFTDHAVWTFTDDEVHGELHVTDFHPPVDIYPKTGQIGLAFRDHGWGKHFWEDFVAHRWVAGTFGSDLTVLAVTHRGGHLRIDLPGAEVLDIELKPLQKGAVSWMADTMAVTDTMSTMMVNGRVGICNFEISNNAGRGRFRPRFAVNGITEDGLHLLT